MNRERQRELKSQEDQAYLQFVDELRKASRLDSPSAEVSRVYKEVIDILTEAFDEYDPEELPKYQDRLANVVQLVKRQEELSDPLFLEDLDKSTKLLDAKVKSRWSTFEKIKSLASTTIRVVGSSSAIVQDILDIGSQSESLGRRAGSIFRGKVRVDDEEARRVRDLIKGNSGQYGDYQSPQNRGSAEQNALTPTSNSIISVKDDKLIGTNTTQNKVLSNLLDVSKDSNVNIKDIKTLLINQERQRDDRTDAATLNSLENKQERNAAIAVRNDRKLLQGVLGAGAVEATQASSGEGGGGSGIADMLVEGYAVKKGAEWVGKGAKGALGAARTLGKKALPVLRKAGPALARALPWLGRGAVAAASSPAAAVVGTGLAAYEVGSLINDYAIDPAVKTLSPMMSNAGQSIAATIGEKTKGIDYYKQLFKQGGLDAESQTKSEKLALDFLLKIATDKEKLFTNAFKNGSLYGDGSYKINNKPSTIEQAQKDVKTAIEQYEQYKRYLSEKEKKGGLTATAKFKGSDGQVYTNPLFKGEEQSSVVPQQNSQEILKSNPTPNPVPAPTPQVSGQYQAETQQASSSPTPNPVPAPTPIIGKSFEEKAPQVMSRLQNDLNISKEDAAAIVGNLGHESAGLKPNINEMKPVVQGSRGGYGWAQWTGSRRRAFEKFAADNNLNPASDEANYQFLVHELKGSEMNSLKALRSAEGIEEKTKVFESSYERAGVKHHDSRIRYAKRALDAEAIGSNDVMPGSREPIQIAMSNLSRENEMAQMQPIILSQNSVGHGKQEEPMPSASMKSVGAPANGASEATLMIALRQSISPLS